MTALEQTRVIDLTDARSIYGAKLLADLGANTVRPETTCGDPLRKRGPFDQESGESLWYLYFCTNRKHFKFDPDDSTQMSLLQSLCANADIVLHSKGAPAANSVDLKQAREVNPELVLIECSSFGEEGPWHDFQAPELVAAALGGTAALTGDVDTPPLKLWGDLNFMISGSYVAVAALAGLYHARRKQQGQSISVPVHECIASCLEHALMWYFCHELFPQSTARVLPRRGSLHWTDMYQVMQAKNGSVMITPLPGTDTQLAWLIEEEVFDDLLDPEFQMPGAHRKYMLRMMEILRSWASQTDAKKLFEEAQARHLPYGIVNHVPDVAQNSQLEARDWWAEYKIGNRTVKGVGAPYQFGKTPVEINEDVEMDGGSEKILDLVDWGSER